VAHSRRQLTKARIGHPTRDLTVRERQVLQVLATVHAATADQLARSVFTGEPSAGRLARRHLLRLKTFGLVRRFPDRSRDRQVGASGFVYALTAAGPHLGAGQHALGGRQRRAWRPTAQFLAHRLGISELYAQLMERAAGGGPVLRTFAAEPDCWCRYLGPARKAAVLRPDALVRLDIGQTELSWFIEIDRGTEPAATIAGKCRAYLHYEATGVEQRRHGVFPGVAFVVPDAARMTVIRRVIARQPPSAQSLFMVTTADRAPVALSEVEVVA
jgi:Replication-relaxation